MNNKKNVPIVEVNDYHLELFPFWKLYIEELGNYHSKFYFPRKYHKEKIKKKNSGGTLGGNFETIIPRKDLHKLSELTTDMEGELVVFNTYQNPNDKYYHKFIKLVDHLCQRYTTAVIVFHGYEPNILKETDTISVLNKFKKSYPLFLHPNLSCHKYGYNYLNCIPIHSRIENTNILSNYDSINIGIIGTVCPVRNYNMIFEALQLINKYDINHKIKIFIIGARPLNNHTSFFNNLIQYVNDNNLNSQVIFCLDLPSVNFKYNLKLLHFIAPLPNLLDYYYTTLSGSIPLALSMSIPLILPNVMANQYNLSNQLVYTKHIYEVLLNLLHFDDIRYEKLKIDITNCYHHHDLTNKNMFSKLSI